MLKRTKMTTYDKAALVVLFVVGLGLLLVVLTDGYNIALFNPKGPIASEQRNLMTFAIGLMLVVIIPSVLLTFFMAWKYRASNKKATYNPNVRHGTVFNLSLWLIPIVFMLIMAVVIWNTTHKLEPNKPIAANSKSLTVQVVAMRWKWLFIYPEQNIATVNFLQIPVGTPVSFKLTADDAPMSSFWVPNLGGQLYAMTGHINHLNLMANTSGDYPGMSAELNGDGFSGMKFTARASSPAVFDDWVRTVKASSSVLDAAEYKKLVRPSKNTPVMLYSSHVQGLYNAVVLKYMHMHPGSYKLAESPHQ